MTNRTETYGGGSNFTLTMLFSPSMKNRACGFRMPDGGGADGASVRLADAGALGVPGSLGPGIVPRGGREL